MKLTLRNKRLTGKLRLSRWAIVALAVVVALGSVGVTYAGMKGQGQGKGNVVSTDQFSTPFSWVVSNDDGSIENVSPYGDIDPGDYGLDPSENQTPGNGCARYDKDVASTTVFLDVDDDPYNIIAIVSTAYPCYYPTIFYGIINDGTVTARIDSIEVDGNFTITELTVTPGGISVGQEIDAGEEVMGNLAIHVEQDAKQDWVYTIRVKIVTSVTECGPCEGQVTMLRLKYNGAEPAPIAVMERKTGNVVFDATVQPGEEFSFYGTTKQGTLGPEIWLFVDGKLVTIIHTSCSHPIGPGLVAGDFEVVYGESKNGRKLCPLP